MVKVAIKNGTSKLKHKLARIIIVHEIWTISVSKKGQLVSYIFGKLIIRGVGKMMVALF